MIKGRTVLAVIAARGGSKGLPGKNVADLGGKPMVAWSVAAGRESRHVDRLILSSDDPAVIAAARAAGCEAPFTRPRRLATDTASIYDVLLHALDALDRPYDYIVLLQATSPLRTGRDIDACIALCDKTGDPVLSVGPAAKPAQWLHTIDAAGRLRRVLKAGGTADRRQDLRRAYMPNGAVYVAPTGWFRRRATFYGSRTRAYVMPAERSVDIDTKLDLLLARAIVADSRARREPKPRPRPARNHGRKTP